MIRAYDDNGNVVDMVEHDKQIRADTVEQYKTALKTILEEESCIHSIDLDIEASKVIDGF